MNDALTAAFLFGILTFALVLSLWAINDATRRGKSPFLVWLLAVVLGFPFGLVAWLLFRPAPIARHAFPAGQGWQG
ncbi:MAG: hypothetical protein ACRD1N_00960 [Terriglobia bacterium]